MTIDELDGNKTNIQESIRDCVSLFLFAYDKYTASAFISAKYPKTSRKMYYQETIIPEPKQCRVYMVFSNPQDRLDWEKSIEDLDRYKFLVKDDILLSQYTEIMKSECRGELGGDEELSTEEIEQEFSNLCNPLNFFYTADTSDMKGNNNHDK